MTLMCHSIKRSYYMEQRPEVDINWISEFKQIKQLKQTIYYLKVTFYLSFMCLN